MMKSKLNLYNLCSKKRPIICKITWFNGHLAAYNSILTWWNQIFCEHNIVLVLVYLPPPRTPKDKKQKDINVSYWLRFGFIYNKPLSKQKAWIHVRIYKMRDEEMPTKLWSQENFLHYQHFNYLEHTPHISCFKWSLKLKILKWNSDIFLRDLIIPRTRLYLFEAKS